MAEDKNTHEVTVAHASFWFTDKGGRNRIAVRGATIKVNDDDYERGEKYDAFVASPADLMRLGELPSLEHLYEDGLEPDEDDLEELSAWMRSASLEDVQTAVAAAAASGVDITALLAAGELNRGTEARADVLGHLAIAYAAAPDPQPEKVDDPDPGPDPAPSTDPVPSEPASDRIDDITDWVGTDVDRAQARLAIELEKGDDARPTLVKALEEIITAPPGGDS